MFIPINFWNMKHINMSWTLQLIGFLFVMSSFVYSWDFCFKVLDLPAQYLPTRNDCSLYIIFKVVVCLGDQYSMVKYAFMFIISNLSLNNKKATFQKRELA